MLADSAAWRHCSSPTRARHQAVAPRHTVRRYALSVPRSLRLVGSVADLSPEEAEILRRSIAMFPPQAPSGLSRERAMAILAQLVRALRELRRQVEAPHVFSASAGEEDPFNGHGERVMLSSFKEQQPGRQVPLGPKGAPCRVTGCRCRI